MYLLTCSFFCIFTLSSLVKAQSCPNFPVIDLGYAKHAPTRVNQTRAYNISYATYANIRFAQPPVGDLRFRKPQLPPPTATEVQDGTGYPLNGTDCLISVPPDLPIAPGVAGVSWGSEDCLFLDVKVPEGAQGQDLPVLHWIYGGGYVFGSKDPWSGDPAGLFLDMEPDQKFIIVASNYRLGALGWMNSFKENTTANLGLWDTLTALQWTKDYISYFGGNPDDITVIGESAGAGNVKLLLTARGGEGEVPFNKAIMTSPGYRDHLHRNADMEAIYSLFLNASGCDNIECLRKLPTEKIAKANQDLLFNVPRQGWLGPKIGYGPIIDGDLIPDISDHLLVQGKYHRSVQKVLTSNMANDGEYFVASETPTWEDLLRVFMTSPTQSTYEATQSVYGNNTESQHLLAQDAVTACHSYWIAKTWCSDAYRYVMSIPPAAHGQDQYYYFDYNAPDTVVPYHNVSKIMQQSFRNFIVEDRMGGASCNKTHWPAYGGLSRWVNITSDGYEIVLGEKQQAERCELWLKLMLDPSNGF